MKNNTIQQSGAKVTAALLDGMVIACGGYNWVTCQAAGTFASNYFTLEGSSDGKNWITLYVIDCTTEAQLASNHIVASGIFKVKCNGLASVRINHGSVTFTGTPLITLTAAM